MYGPYLERSHFVKAKILMLAALIGFSLGCGKKDDAADHNKNLPPVTAKPGDLQPMGAAGPGKGGSNPPVSVAKPTAPP